MATNAVLQLAPWVVPEANARMATALDDAAELLVWQGDNPFRAKAYRRAADALRSLRYDIADTPPGPEGRRALDAIPGVGPSIASAILEMLATGRWGFLERLRGEADPEALFCRVPSIGPSLAHRLHEALHIETLEELELAAHDGRLERLAGFGPRRAAMVRAALAEMLAKLPRAMPPDPSREPAVALLLEVDQEYREAAAEGLLRRIAPRRFNPTGEASLPVMHGLRGPWHVTALFSNTALAHRLGRDRDWVVIYFHRDGLPEGRRTVVTETTGPLRGRRVVRGREAECAAAAGLAE